MLPGRDPALRSPVTERALAEHMARRVGRCTFSLPGGWSPIRTKGWAGNLPDCSRKSALLCSFAARAFLGSYVRHPSHGPSESGTQLRLPDPPNSILEDCRLSTSQSTSDWPLWQSIENKSRVAGCWLCP